MRTVLIVDDLEDSASVIAEEVKKGIPGVQCPTELDFDKAIEHIADLRPDAIVLDLMEGKFSEILPGEKTWKSIWESTFCPIVIYTASDATLQPTVPPNHPFVKRIKKSSGSHTQLVDALKGFTPAAESVRSLRAEVDAVIHKVLRDTAGEGQMPMNDAAFLLHAGRRRIAASMDDPTITSQRTMASWEIYLVPAIGKDALTGDLLLKRGDPKGNAVSYRVVLSPSCDLARGGKVKAVLAARCHASTVMLDKFRSSVKPKDDAELKKQLSQLVLTQGAWNGWMPLPAFADVIPALMANLKDLELIPYESIGPADPAAPGFDRVASIDSPFREQVAWAYLTTAARPAMPDRDMESWAEECVIPAAPPVAPLAQTGKPASGA